MQQVFVKRTICQPWLYRAVQNACFVKRIIMRRPDFERELRSIIMRRPRHPAHFMDMKVSQHAKHEKHEALTINNITLS